MPRYYYEGPVYHFEYLYSKCWMATTTAPSREKAFSNLSYRFKMENGMNKDSNVRLEGKLTEIVERRKQECRNFQTIPTIQERDPRLKPTLGKQLSLDV